LKSPTLFLRQSMSEMVENTEKNGVLTKKQDENVQKRLKDRIKQLEKEKFASAEHVRRRLEEFRERITCSEDDESFLTLLVEGWIEHTKKIKTLDSQLQQTQRQKDALSTLSKKLSEKNKQLTKWREEMQGQVDKGIAEVKSKISLYEEENQNILAENNNLKSALKKALDYNQQRTDHMKVLQSTNDFLREKHDEMDKKYQDICNEYQLRLEELSKDHTALKQRYEQRGLQNIQLKEQIRLIAQKQVADDETRKMVNEFESKYKKLLEESSKCVDQYKTYNEKLMKTNKALKTKEAQSRSRLEKMKGEHKDLKKKSHKLDKKVSTLTNLCRDLQAKNKTLSEKPTENSNETTV